MLLLVKTLAVQVYSFNFASIVTSRNVAVRNVTLYSTPGMGVYTNNVSGASEDGGGGGTNNVLGSRPSPRLT